MIRIQRRRAKGWRMPANTIYVGRPTIYGNPFRVPFPYGERERQEAVDLFRDWWKGRGWVGRRPESKIAALRPGQLFYPDQMDLLTGAMFQTEPHPLKGHNLALLVPARLALPRGRPARGGGGARGGRMTDHLHYTAQSDDASRMWARKWAAEVERETVTGRAKFVRAHHMLDCAEPGHLRPRTVWEQVLLEEVGKLARCSNKLSLAVDVSTRAHWAKEGREKLVTIASIIRRMAEEWDRLAGPEGDTP